VGTVRRTDAFANLGLEVWPESRRHRPSLSLEGSSACCVALASRTVVEPPGPSVRPRPSRRVAEARAASIRREVETSDSESSGRIPRSAPRAEDRPGENLVDQGGIRIVWDDRWHEEEIFANRLSFYILAQSFLVVAAVTATLSTDATDRWLPVALTIDLTGLLLTMIFWYALTENLRRLDALKEIVAEGSREIRVRGYREIGTIRTSHHERRAERALPLPLSLFPRWSPSWWLAHWIPILLGSAWIALIAVAIVTAA